MKETKDFDTFVGRWLRAMLNAVSEQSIVGCIARTVLLVEPLNERIERHPHKNFERIGVIEFGLVVLFLDHPLNFGAKEMLGWTQVANASFEHCDEAR